MNTDKIIEKFIETMVAIWGELWIVILFIVAIQFVIVGGSTYLIVRKRKNKPRKLSDYFSGKVVKIRGIFNKILFEISSGKFRLRPLERKLNSDGKFTSNIIFRVIPFIGKLAMPSASYVLVALATGANVSLFIADTGLGVIGVSIPYETLLLLNVISIILAFYQQVAFWQIQSDLLFRYRMIDEKWHEPGLTHRIYLLEALDAVEQVAGYTSHMCQRLTGEEGIQDVDGDQESILNREQYVEKLLEVQKKMAINFFRLDKDPGCSERIIEDIFMLIGEKTVSPLMKSVYGIQQPSASGDEWFPVAYATLVWESSLKLADSLGTQPSATSIIPFPKFYKLYSEAEVVHPVTKAQRIFIVDPEYKWEQEMLAELNAIGSHANDAEKLPLSKDGSERITHFEWIDLEHREIGWEVKFIGLREVLNIKKQFKSFDLPKYLDFLLIPGTNSWNVRFSSDIGSRKEIDGFMLPAECCPLRVDYISSTDTQTYFNALWEKGECAGEWLEINVTLNELAQSDSFKLVKDRLKKV